MRFSAPTARLAVVAVFGCGSATEPAALETRVSVGRPSLRVGDTLAAWVTVTNRGAQAAVVYSACTGPIARLFDAVGARVDARFCAIPETQAIRLAPGDSIVAVDRLPMTQPGAFTVVGGFDVRGDLVVRSAPAVVDVAPR